jgi:hypothetical protein
MYGTNATWSGYQPLELVPPIHGEVTATNVASGTEYNTSSNSSGHFSLEVPTGTYRVSGGRGLTVFPVKVVGGRTTVVFLCSGCSTIFG